MEIRLGAIEEERGEYVYPSEANKRDKYRCPECGKGLIFRKGNKNREHFAHKREEEPCGYYTQPTEGQIHKDAKMLVKKLLDKGIKIEVKSRCIMCKEERVRVVESGERNVIEYRFEYEGLKIADVACVKGEDIENIIEIYNKHKTREEDRPEPWCEIEAERIIRKAGYIEDNKIKIRDMRVKKCERCKKKKKIHIVARGFDINERIYLNVPYSRKEEIKGVKGRWDVENRKWYIMRNNRKREEILREYEEIEYVSCERCHGTGIYCESEEESESDTEKGFRSDEIVGYGDTLKEEDRESGKEYVDYETDKMDPERRGIVCPSCRCVLCKRWEEDCECENKGKFWINRNDNSIHRWSEGES